MHAAITPLFISTAWFDIFSCLTLHVPERCMLPNTIYNHITYINNLRSFPRIKTINNNHLQHNCTYIVEREREGRETWEWRIGEMWNGVINLGVLGLKFVWENWVCVYCMYMFGQKGWSKKSELRWSRND